LGTAGRCERPARRRRRRGREAGRLRALVRGRPRGALMIALLIIIYTTVVLVLFKLNTDVHSVKGHRRRCVARWSVNRAIEVRSGVQLQTSGSPTRSPRRHGRAGATECQRRSSNTPREIVDKLHRQTLKALQANCAFASRTDRALSRKKRGDLPVGRPQ